MIRREVARLARLRRTLTEGDEAAAAVAEAIVGEVFEGSLDGQQNEQLRKDITEKVFTAFQQNFPKADRAGAVEAAIREAVSIRQARKGDF